MLLRSGALERFCFLRPSVPQKFSVSSSPVWGIWRSCKVASHGEVPEYLSQGDALGVAADCKTSG